MNRREQALARSMNRLALEHYARLGITPRVAEVRDWGDLRRTYPNEKLLPKRMPAECGTASGYYRHRRRDEPACAACKEAYMVQRRNGGGRRKAAA